MGQLFNIILGRPPRQRRRRIITSCFDLILPLDTRRLLIRTAWPFLSLPFPALPAFTPRKPSSSTRRDHFTGEFCALRPPPLPLHYPSFIAHHLSPPLTGIRFYATPPASQLRVFHLPLLRRQEAIPFFFFFSFSFSFPPSFFSYLVGYVLIFDC